MRILIFSILPDNEDAHKMSAQFVRTVCQQSGFSPAVKTVARGDRNSLLSAMRDLATQEFDLSIVLVHAWFDDDLDANLFLVGVERNPGDAFAYNEFTGVYDSHPENTADYFASIFPSVARSHKVLLACHGFNYISLAAFKYECDEAKTFISISEERELTGQMIADFIGPFFRCLANPELEELPMDMKIRMAFNYAKRSSREDGWYLSEGFEIAEM